MKWLLCKCIRGYQIFLSPALHFFGGPGSGCRFEPTCSQYCMDAIRVHGCLRGGWLGIRRLCRCQPWGPSGHDPVPGMEASEGSEPSAKTSE